MIFRIDDISVNTNLKKLSCILDILQENGCENIMLAVSPLVQDMEFEKPGDKERAFKRILSARSDHREFFQVDRLGIPEILVSSRFKGTLNLASHGLLHIDHRLLSRDVQEMSILSSCHLLKTKTFVPPFNKYNMNTESVCREHGIELVRFEDGWKHANHNDYDPKHQLYYIHTHDISTMKLENWFREGLNENLNTPTEFISL